jgi:hypothetical protein
MAKKRKRKQIRTWGGEDEVVAYAVRFIKGWQHPPQSPRLAGWSGGLDQAQ